MSEILYNENSGRYEQDFRGHLVYARTRKREGVLYIDYVEAAPELRGSGAAGKFMEGLMGLVKAEELKVIPICGYAASWLRRHSKYSGLMAQN
jgi:predicted GNAT family acetyltransferase